MIELLRTLQWYSPTESSMDSQSLCIYAAFLNFMNNISILICPPDKNTHASWLAGLGSLNQPDVDFELN